jgi:hypothetical protein
LLEQALEPVLLFWFPLEPAQALLFWSQLSLGQAREMVQQVPVLPS